MLSAAQIATLKVLAHIGSGHARDIARIRFPDRDTRRTATGVGSCLSALLSQHLVEWEGPKTEIYTINQQGERLVKELSWLAQT